VKSNPSTSRMRAAFVAALFLVLGAGSNAFGQATTTTTNEELPISSSVVNQCNGDTVAFSGTMHIVNTMATDAGGGTHLKTHINYQDVTGTGAPSGLSYNVRTVSNEVVNDNDGPQYTATVISTVKLIAQGPSMNFFLRTVLHVTINANGETTSTVQEMSIECRGRQ